MNFSDSLKKAEMIRRKKIDELNKKANHLNAVDKIISEAKQKGFNNEIDNILFDSINYLGTLEAKKYLKSLK
jgi:hypothetical protein